MSSLLNSPLFWGVTIFMAVLAYLMGRRSNRADGPSGNTTSTKQASAPPVRMPPPTPPAGPSQRGRPALGSVKSWGYQLQDLDIARAAASPFDLLVIDYTKDGSDETRLTSAEIERMKRKPDGSRRIVLAYVSIGEAESYRPYWDATWKKQRPEWLLRENPEWKENYAVCFWHPGRPQADALMGLCGLSVYGSGHGGCDVLPSYWLIIAAVVSS